MKSVKGLSNNLLIEDTLYGIRANKNAMGAIESSVTRGTIFVDEGYIKEKLTSVKQINTWLPKYIREARERYDSGSLSMEQMTAMNPYFTF